MLLSLARRPAPSTLWVAPLNRVYKVYCRPTRTFAHGWRHGAGLPERIPVQLDHAAARVGFAGVAVQAGVGAAVVGERVQRDAPGVAVPVGAVEVHRSERVAQMAGVAAAEGGVQPLALVHVERIEHQLMVGTDAALVAGIHAEVAETVGWAGHRHRVTGGIHAGRRQLRLQQERARARRRQPDRFQVYARRA